MSGFKIKFTLKQHTPLIHFQADQIGATLRATELKPKFDRYLLGLKELRLKPSKGSQGERFFDYKVKIAPIKNIRYESIEKYNKNPPLYFARDNKKFSFGKLQVEFISFNTTLIKIIKKEFPKFLAITNFGSRSSKGYGSFWDEKTPSRLFVSFAQQHYQKVYTLNNKVQHNTWEKTIGDFYKMVKMGNNHPYKEHLYKKAYLWEYFAREGIRWEKRKIKKEFPNLAVSTKGKPPVDVKNPKDENFRFIRAMLGLAGHYEFRTLNKKPPEKVTITCSDRTLKRMRSPIEFKVINDTVYLLCNEHYKRLYDKEFDFNYKGKSFKIKTPKESEFDLYKFMDYLVQRDILKVAQ